MSRRHPHPARAAAALTAVLVLAGCASVNTEQAFSPVNRAVKQQLGQDLRWVRSAEDQEAVDAVVARLLAKPLAMDDAVQLALLNNRGLQADLHGLGIAQAEWAQAGRLPNPGISFGRLRRGDEVELETGLHLNLARLLMLPRLQEMEGRRLGQTQGMLTLRVLGLAADTRKAWINAVAAEEGVRYQRQVAQAAQAGAELARRMAQVGNFSTLQLAREQSFQADAALGLAQTQRLADATRERLVRQLGLWGSQSVFTLPERLPDLPAAAKDQPEIESLALAQRLDVQAARLNARNTAADLGLTRSTRFINVLELGAVRNRSNEAPTQRGWEVGLELPLFDWGDARVARAESRYLQAVQRTSEVAINARSEVREAYGNYRAAWDIARHQRDQIVPLRRRIAQENVLRYNGMLIGVFELLADARMQIAGVNGAITALADFWRAQADLDMALIGPPELGMASAPAASGGADAAGGGH